jgi:hypothetical protein
VTPYEQELRECLATILGASLPVPDYETFLFFKQWLAERNLGLRQPPPFAQLRIAGVGSRQKHR